VPSLHPHTHGACDAAGLGLGVVYFVPDSENNVIPLQWREPFPDWVTNWLVSFANPDRDITNSDLELTGSVAHNDILAQAAGAREKTTHNSYDNMATVYW